MVWVIRNFRPDIIITRFATDGSGGHGHHTASAILAEEAFDAAADPTRFPEQLKYVDVWQTRRMFYNSGARFWNPNADLSSLIKLDVGGYNPLLGKSYGEIAAESRSMHKSQGFGSAKQRGEYFEYFKPLKGDTTGLKDIFEGMDFSWKRVKGGEKIGKMIEKIIKEYKVERPEESIKSLLNLKNIYKNEKLDEIILSCFGAFIELSCNSSYFTSYDTKSYNVNIVNRGKESIKLNKITYENGSLANAGKGIENDSMPIIIMPSKQIILNKNSKPFPSFRQAVNLTTSDWTSSPKKENLFTLNNQQLLDPYLPSAFSAQVYLEINGIEFKATKYLVNKIVDPEKGELYKPVVLKEPISIFPTSKQLVFNNNEPKTLSVIVKSNNYKIIGELEIENTANWKIIPNSHRINITALNKDTTVEFQIYPTSNSIESNIKIVFNTPQQKFSHSIKEIKYDHIPIQTLFPEAEAKLVRLDINKKLKRIGYIPGAGDEVQSCLSQLGYEVITITDDMLTKENLSQFEAIITGVRAYNTNEKLSTYKQKLMDYVSNGGNLIVQYNTNSFVGPFKGDIGPYPFKITRDRVTDENAIVNFELPNHPVLNTPNKITSADFEGWIQERCIYTGGDVDAKYEMPLSMADPDEKTNKGSLIIAKYGKGNFIYSGLVFFRELPAGVPGAYRLLVNMIELGK